MQIEALRGKQLNEVLRVLRMTKVRTEEPKGRDLLEAILRVCFCHPDISKGKIVASSKLGESSIRTKRELVPVQIEALRGEATQRDPSSTHDDKSED